MEAWETLDRASAPQGVELVLSRRGDEYVIRAGGHELMSSRTHGSEESLAQLGCGHLQRCRGARVLVGGLGLGYTLRAALDLLGPDASVLVVELVAAVVSWNRGVLAPLAGAPLADPRVQVEIGDVVDALRARSAAFDAVLLDVDNGPSPLVRGGNARLYSAAGVDAARHALRPGGVLAVWSAGEDRTYERRLARGGFDVETHRVPVRAAGGRVSHVVFTGRAGVRPPAVRPRSRRG